MLQAWISPRWALIGGLCAILHTNVGITSYWAQSYWGGAATACGGALLLGGVRRIFKGPNFIDALLMSAGAAMLVCSRPMEGLLVMAPVAGLLIYYKVRRAKSAALRRRFLRVVVVPVMCAAAATLAFIGYYNFRVTKNPLVTPYQSYETQYSSIPYMFWQSPRPAMEFRHKEMYDYDMKFSRPFYLRYQGFLGAATQMWQRAKGVWNIFLPYGIWTVLLSCSVLLLFLRNRWMWFAYGALGFFCIMQATSLYLQRHYFAPILPLVFLLFMQGLRVIFWLKARKRRIGPSLFGFVIVALMVLCLAEVNPARTAPPVLVERPVIVNYLLSKGGQHLVIVRYGADHNSLNEWVYNGADIDRAPIVWAHEMNSGVDPLLAYYKSRQVWLLDMRDDRLKPKLLPYRPDPLAPAQS
jgi:hypothetical protein